MEEILLEFVINLDHANWNQLLSFMSLADNGKGGPRESK